LELEDRGGPVIEEKTDGYKSWAEVKVNRDVAVLLLLSLRYRIDFRILLYLYEKFREDVFFFFFLLAGREVRFPTHQKLLRLISSASDVISDQSSDDFNSLFLSKVLSDYGYDGETIKIPLSDRKLFCLGVYGDMDGGLDDGTESN
jgi:hypothetical protein